MQIKTLINKEQALKMFDEEAALFGCGAFVESSDTGMPLYRIGELFGLQMLDWFEHDKGTVFKPGLDYGLVGGGACADVFLSVVHQHGFMRFVCRHNRMLAHESHMTSEAGKHLNILYAERSARLAAEDAENQRKREERKAKRAAARKAKQEAAEQAVSA